MPRRAIAWTARWTYNEPYLAVKMWHALDLDPERGGVATYGWTHQGTAFALRAAVHGPALPLVPGSEAEFNHRALLGRYAQRDGTTIEYEVVHPPWLVWTAEAPAFSGDATGLYGADFAGLLSQPPQSAFIAAGSPVEVYAGRKVPAPV